MLTRRGFLSSLAASAAAKFLVLQEGDDGVKVQPNANNPPPKDMPVTFHFGDFAPMLASDPAELRIHTPTYRDPATGRYFVDRTTHIDVKRVIAPKAVFDAVLEHYKDITKVAERGPLVIKMGEQVLATITHVFFQQLGWQVESGGMVVVENLGLVGVWKELAEAREKYNDAAQKYYEAQEREVALRNKVNAVEEPKTEPHWCEDCNDFHE